jgi:hypothetical protein
MATVVRLIWLRWNKLVFKGVFQAPAKLVRTARD